MKRLFVLASITTLIQASWILETRLVSYTNPHNIDFQGQCCDLFCFTPCDVYFTFCLRSINTSPANPGNCQQHVTTTRWHTIATSSIHPPAQGPLYAGCPVSNPIRFVGDHWSGRFQLLVSTEDADPDPDDLIDRNAFNQELAPTGAWTAVIRVHGYYQAAHVAMQFRVSCAQYYYSQTCSVYCKAQDDNVEGHYNCNSDGGKVCLSGWSEPDNNCLTPICAEGCRNGGCTVPGECSCLSGWFGELCDECHPGPSCSDSGEPNEEDVIPNSCLNGATCISHDGGCTCQCAPGWTGHTCNTSINDCDPNPCQNNGNCTDRLADYQCDCAVGYYGKSCEKHYCDSSPCNNGATCTGTADGYVCTCPRGVTGTNCSVNINECASLPCKNGGTCVDLLGDYSCSCPDQYRGKSCEYNKQTPHCSPNPCPQGFTCAEGDRTDYVCIPCSNQSSECNTANMTLQDNATPIGAAVGGIIGALVVCLFCLLVVLLVVFLLRNKREPPPQPDRQAPPQPDEPPPARPYRQAPPRPDQRPPPRPDQRPPPRPDQRPPPRPDRRPPPRPDRCPPPRPDRRPPPRPDRRPLPQFDQESLQHEELGHVSDGDSAPSIPQSEDGVSLGDNAAAANNVEEVDYDIRQPVSIDSALSDEQLHQPARPHHRPDGCRPEQRVPIPPDQPDIDSLREDFALPPMDSAPSSISSVEIDVKPRKIGQRRRHPSREPILLSSGEEEIERIFFNRRKKGSRL